MEYGLVVLWWLTYVVLAAAGLPIAALVFRWLPGHGVGLSLPVAVSIVTLVAFWIGHVTFGWLAIGGGLGVLVVLAALSVRASFAPDRRAVFESLLVFSFGFCFMVAVRAVDPGLLPFLEDFLDFGVMQAILRADRLPPEDFWFAGSPIRYYYGGHLIAAIMTRLTHTSPWYSINLVLAGFYAMLLAAVYDLSGAIALSRGRSRVAAGSTAVFFVGFAGSLLVPVAAVIRSLPDLLRAPVAESVAGELGRPAAELIRVGFSKYEYWDVLETIPEALTPFPLFSWLHGELHAHMTSAPFLVLAVAVCYSYFRTPEDERLHRRLLVFGVLPVAAGLVAFIDLWSFPTTLGLLWLSLVFGSADPLTLLPGPVARRVAALSTTRLRSELVRTTGSIGLVAVTAVLGILLVSPFVLVTARGGGGAESVGIVSAVDRTSFVELFIVHGAFVLLFAVYLVDRVRPRVDVRLERSETAATAAALGLVLPVAWYANIAAVVLFLPFLLVGWYALRSDFDVGYESVLVVAGTGLVLLAEFVYLANQEYVIPGRGNTVFRVYMQTWVLWGIAAGVVLPRLLTGRSALRLPSSRHGKLRTGFVVLLLLSTGVYGGLSTYNHFDRAFEQPTQSWEQAAYVYEARQMQGGPDAPTNPPTLDGLLYASVEHPNETDAVRWITNNVSGTPTMVSAPGGRWEWRSPAAGLTGVPTVAGWGHELVYRDWETYYDRVDDVRSIYRGGPTLRVDLLRQYDVEYVYVGPDERERYQIWPFSVLDGVSVAYENEAVTIYEVNQSELGVPSRPVVPRRYGAGDLAANESVATVENGTIAATGGRNGSFAWYGPYTTLFPGTYTATFELNVTSNDSDGEPVVTVDVARGAAVRGTDFEVLASRSVSGTDGVRNVTITFTLDRVTADVEFRGILGNGDGSVRLRSVTVHNATTDRSAERPDRFSLAHASIPTSIPVDNPSITPVFSISDVVGGG